MGNIENNTVDRQEQFSGNEETANKPKTPSSKVKPDKKSQLFPVVGIGASAGGLEAFTELLKNLPAQTGMAFVYVQHLASG